LEDVGDFFVAEVLQVAEDDDLAKDGVDAGEGVFDKDVLFAVEGVVERGAAGIGEGALTGSGVVELLFETDLVLAMAEEPAPAIVAFVDRDAVDPGAQAALGAEMADAAEDFEEYFLSDVASVAGIAEQAIGEIVDGLLEAGDEAFVRLFTAGLQRDDKLIVFAGALPLDVQNAGGVHLWLSDILDTIREEVVPAPRRGPAVPDILRVMLRRVSSPAIAFAEGFSTLAVEVIAIRLAIRVVGSSMTLTGVMLGVLLLALSAGYWFGGLASAKWPRNRAGVLLARNMAIAAAWYGGIAFPFEAKVLEVLLNGGVPLAVTIGLAALALFALPVYLASQTIPVLAELDNCDGAAGKASGRVLFFSTLGSVAGGIVTPVWLFPSLGVARTGWFVCCLLGAAAVLAAAGGLRRPLYFVAGAAPAAIWILAQSLQSDPERLFAFDSAYQSTEIRQEEIDDGRHERVFIMGGGRESGIIAETGEASFAYSKAADRAIAEAAPVAVLVVGAAGFNIPRDAARMATVTRVDAVDVDPAVRSIAEKYFLREPLPAKVRFLAMSGRYAVRKLRREGNQYSVAMVDAYLGQDVPEELTTVEFFDDLRLASARTAVNIVVDRKLESAFARNLLASFRAAFGEVWVAEADDDRTALGNVIVTSWAAKGSRAWTGNGIPYRDDRCSASLDHTEILYLKLHGG
jgi:hypothetical protein